MFAFRRAISAGRFCGMARPRGQHRGQSLGPCQKRNIRVAPAGRAAPDFVDDVPQHHGSVEDPDVRVCLAPPVIEEVSHSHTLRKHATAGDHLGTTGGLPWKLSPSPPPSYTNQTLLITHAG